MKHQALEQLQILAEVDQDYPRQTLTRSQRLERWAQLLEQNPERRLSTLHQTEYQPASQRAAMRGDSTPISVAFDDPVLRAAGLEDDSYGEAKRFFQLSDRQLHNVICYCHFGATVNAATAAYYIRRLVPKAGQRGIFSRLREMFVG
jgi:predicted acyl esterase